MKVGQFVYLNTNKNSVTEVNEDLAEEYVVYSAELSGGDRGLCYPNSWFVKGKSLNSNDEISFYQSG